MRLGTRAALGFCLAAYPLQSSCFTPCTNTFLTPPKSTNTKVSSTTAILSSSTTSEDCGCGPTVYAGKPSEIARKSINHRAVIGDLPIFKVDGSKTSLNGIIGESKSDPNKTSLVVFMRSLGCPFCQEQIVQYNRIRHSELLTNGVDLVVISIGKPEIGKKLIDHLEVTNGEEWIFVDPANILYDALELNSGIETTFFSPDIPFAFRDRFFGMNGRKDGTKDLFDVLGKWKDAVYIPPKTEQAFQQGGVFVFKGADTAFAYYDAGAGTHLEVSKAVAEALKVA